MKLPWSVTVIVLVPVAPGAIVRALGEAERANPGVLGVTVNVNVEDLVRVPEVATMVDV